MAEGPFLIVGLGNPGEKYARTRHNAGFWVVDLLTDGISPLEKFEGLFYVSGRLYFLKPQTYMNLSGRSVAAAVRFYKLDPATQLLVIVDDLDLPTGRLRLRKAGSAGGHNGLKSIIECLGTEGFPRIRIGIGRGPGQAHSHVLGKISKEEEELYGQAVNQAAEAVKVTLEKGFEAAMNQFNKREKA